MKRFYILLLLIFSLSNVANAEDIFSDLENINTIKCSGSIISGSLDIYDNQINYYTFGKDGNIYSSNLNSLFGDITKEPKKVLNLKISDDYITFKDRLIKFEGTYYNWVKINRKTGEYLLTAKNDFGFFFKRANVKGTCSIEN